MRHRFFAAAYRGSAVPQISIWLGLCLGLLPSGVAAASEAPMPTTAAPVLNAVPASTALDASSDTGLDLHLDADLDADPDANPDVNPDVNATPDASASGISAEPAVTPDVILESFTANAPAGAEAVAPPDPSAAQQPDASTSEPATSEPATSEPACVVGCDRATPFVFRAPTEAIAPFPAAQPLPESATAPETEDTAPTAPTTTSAPIAPTAPIVTTRLERRALRAAARTATRAAAPTAPTTPAAPPTAIAPIEPTEAIAPVTRTAETRAAARATTANRAATRATVRATTADRDQFGIQMISSPPLAVPVPVSDSDYQTPFSPGSSPDASTPADASTPSNEAPSDPAFSDPAFSDPATGIGTPTATPTAANLSRRRPLTPPSLQIHGVYVYQGGESSARVRFTGVYPITPNLQAGGSIDLTTGDGGLFNEENSEGVSINELYLTASLPSMPNLRFVIGQIDLTSYFDRNSFAKDGETQFFNPIFQTNPALTAVGIGSRAGALVNWSATDDLEIKAAAFSSDRSISDFSIDGFAGEIGLRLTDNLVVRGTYATGRDNGSNSGFREIYSIQNGRGLQDDDREEAYGVNAELFIPQIGMGIFGRYGHYRNLDIDLGGNTFVFGVSFLDLFMANDRLGIGYGRGLSNDRLRQDLGNSLSDVGEIFYDFEVVPHLRLGFTLQALNNFSETIAGVRVRTVFNLSPRRSH